MQLFILAAGFRVSDLVVGTSGNAQTTLTSTSVGRRGKSTKYIYTINNK